MLADLVAKRKSCQICMTSSPGKLVNGSAFDFDPDVVSHWAQWLGHPSPRILIVGQDFADVGYFERHRGADDPLNATNINLARLLAVAGLPPKPPPGRDTQTPIFLTNAVLCLKQPPMSRPISQRWVRNCAGAHLRPLVETLRPMIIVAMGSSGWTAVRLALGIIDAPRAISTAAGGSWVTNSGRIFAVGHCGPLGLVNRPWHRQLEDWQAIGEVLRT